MSHVQGRICPTFHFNWLRWIGVALIVTGMAHAVTITVPCSGSGGGASGLIAAINKSNNTLGSNTINLTPGCVYTLTRTYQTYIGNNGLPLITGIITINGYGATIARSLSAADVFRIFFVASGGTLVLNTVTVRGGYASVARGTPEPGQPEPGEQAPAFGGGLIVDAGGTLTLNYSVVTGNVAYSPGDGIGGGYAYGGGISNRGRATLNYSVISKNTATSVFASGGGIFNEGALTLNWSTVTQNRADASSENPAAFGGGISSRTFQPGAGLIIRHSVVSYNTARGPFKAWGGGIDAAGPMSVAYSVIRNNTATATYVNGQARGGGISFFGTANVVSLYRSVIYGNTASSNGSLTSSKPHAAGGGLAINGFGSAVTLLYTVVHCNIARALAGQARGGGIENTLLDTDPRSNTVTLKYGKVVNNTAQGATLANSLGGGIYNANPASGSVTLIANPVTSNHPDQCDPTGSVPGCSN